MMDILIPKYPEASFEGWPQMEFILPNGYRHVASVHRPDGSGYTMRGQVWDLGQNAEGKFRIFRRGTGQFENGHIAKGEAVSDEDMAGFGLTREQCPFEPGDEGYGVYSSICKTNLLILS